MKKTTCIHPRRMVNLMRNFVLAASDLEYETFEINDDDLWDYKNWESIYLKSNCKIKRTGSFQAFIGEFEDDDSLIIIGYDFKKLPYLNDYFTIDFRKRCKIAKGFTGITLALLHELGHFETNSDCEELFPDWDREKANEEVSKKYKPTNDLANANKEYFTWPDERMATEWAMDWLSVPENRKIAKAFEKAFLACFE